MPRRLGFHTWAVGFEAMETIIALIYLLLVACWVIRPRRGSGLDRFRPWTGDPDDWPGRRRAHRRSDR